MLLVRFKTTLLTRRSRWWVRCRLGFGNASIHLWQSGRTANGRRNHCIERHLGFIFWPYIFNKKSAYLTLEKQHQTKIHAASSPPARNRFACGELTWKIASYCRKSATWARWSEMSTRSRLTQKINGSTVAQRRAIYWRLTLRRNYWRRMGPR